eukprot:g2248.t1
MCTTPSSASSRDQNVLSAKDKTTVPDEKYDLEGSTKDGLPQSSQLPAESFYASGCPNKCHGHGNCNEAKVGGPTCSCHPGWHGKFCQQVYFNDKNHKGEIIKVDILPPEAEIKGGLAHDASQGERGANTEDMARLLRSLRQRIAYLRSHQEQVGAKTELRNLQLSLLTIGGTKPIWDMSVVKNVVGNKVKVALERAARVESDFKIFADPADSIPEKK